MAMKETKQKMVVLGLFLLPLFTIPNIAEAFSAQCPPPATASFFKRGLNFLVRPESQRDQATIDNALDDLSANYPISRSNLERFHQMLKYKQDNCIQELDMVATMKVKGTIMEVSLQPGKLPTEGKHYYVGESGSYEYRGKLVIMVDGRKSNIFFSPHRMELLRISEMTEQGDLPRTFDSLREGEAVEIEENVDLIAPNVNDENVRSVTLKIVRETSP